ncbi:twitching motility protein PilI [Litorivivens lipolytica]|uniref:Twitching motility protein PilI n=1 Tax=Litorivivens lipolytica TaxID=1524264 RepID=A0A7W4Z7Z0_9GAMM|nr:chemotaxis protein CheW [Litorivivens lipolytica]MBB3048406.1 twitching motility protein PilI [Litorivivens lipolytica]
MQLPDEPFDQLVALANRSVAVSSGLPQQTEIVPEWTGISFELGGARLVAPMGQVTEILTLPPYTRLPSVQDWVRGVANVRGRLLPLMDMEAFLGGSLDRSRKSHRVLVLEMGELYSGLIVSSVRGMETFPVDQYSPEMPDGIPEVLQPYIDGSYVQEDGVRAVFSPEKLIQDDKFYNVAA